METAKKEPQKTWMNKVPEVTLVFWLIKMMSTTVGETAADYLDVNLCFGLTNTSILMGILLAVALFFQIRTNRYIPSLYWLSVVFISVFGTLITDNLTDHFEVPLVLSTIVFSVLLLITFAFWYAREKTLSIHHVDSIKRELFYWTAVLFTFALGTAAGDWVAEGFEIGYAYAALLFGVLIAATALAWRYFKVNSVLCFWIAYILTRPFGASCGDLLSQDATHGGLGLGVTGTSVLFLIAIIGLVIYLTIAERKRAKGAIR